MPVVVASQVLFLLTCGTVGVRLIGLWRRTGREPEMLLGASLLTMVVCLPVLTASGMGRGSVGDLRLPLVALGLGLLSLAVAGMSGFTWKTFRPHSRWGAIAVVAIAALQGCALAGSLHALAAADPGVPSTRAATGWLVLLRLPGLANFCWTAVEAFVQWRMARRRLAVGLGDPVVANRFALWCVIGVFLALNNAVSTYLQSRGMGPVAHPVGASAVAVAAVVSATLMWLVFLTPERYHAWILERAARAAALRGASA